MQKKWVKITEILHSNIPATSRKVWIESLRPELEGLVLKLYAPNAFMANFTRARFFSFLDKAVKEVYGSNHSCEIVSAESSKSQNNGATRMHDAVTKVNAETIPVKLTNQVATIVAKPHKTERPTSQMPVQLSQMPVVPTGNQTLSAEPQITVTSMPNPRPLPTVQLTLPVEMPNRNTEQVKNWRYSFDDFVVGSSNELAFAASKNMCSEFMQSNILYLNSSPGLGKTHLLHSVGQNLSVSCNRASTKLEYVTAEEFTSQFLFSLQNRTVDQFKARYRSLDLLLLEDMHFLQNKEQTQMELLETIKAIYDRGGKVVLTSSFSVKELKNINEQLLSRLSSGFISPIHKPDFDTRCRIFRHKAQKHQVILPSEVECLLAEHIQGDVRQIESSLQNMILKAQIYKTGITTQMAWDVISNYAAHSPDLNLEVIIQQVCKLFGLSMEQLLSPRRKKDYVTARNSAFYLARKHTGLSLEAIGERFNKKHSTVLKGITNLEREISRQTPEGRQIAHTISLIERCGEPMGKQNATKA